MINDPEICVVCDCCGDEIYIEPEYRYADFSGKNGYYDCSDSAIERSLSNLHMWIVEKGKHFCCEECKKDFDES